MAANKRLTVGLVGCGIIGQARHLPTLRRLKGVEVVAVCDRDEGLAREAARRFGIGGHYADFAEMLEKERPDIADITVAPKAHAPLSIQAMNAGCHVLVEKPMAESVKEADEVVAVAREKGVRLCVIHNNLFSPTVLKAREMIRQGKLGRVTGIDIKTPWPTSNKEMADSNHWYHRLPGGLFGEILPHTIYLAMGFLGKVEPVAVHARKFTDFDFIRSDELRVILDAERAVGTVTISCSWNKNKVLIDIFGTERCLHLDVINTVMTEYGRGRMTYNSHVAENLKQGWQQLAGTAAVILNVLSGRYSTGHEAVISGFVRSLQQGTEMPVSMEQAREVVRVVEKIAQQVESTWK